MPDPSLHAQAEAFIREVLARPSMYIGVDESVSHICSYLAGFDQARDGGPLSGLREWLIVRGLIGTNQGWPAVLFAVQRGSETLADQLDHLRRLFDEFFVYRHEGGVTRIHVEYARWLASQPWYHGPLRSRARVRKV